MKALGRDWDQNRDKGKERKLPEYSWYYCFPGYEFGHKWTVLVGREKQSKSWMASAMPSNGLVSGRSSIDKCLEFIDERWHRDLALGKRDDLTREYGKEAAGTTQQARPARARSGEAR